MAKNPLTRIYLPGPLPQPVIIADRETGQWALWDYQSQTCSDPDPDGVARQLDIPTHVLMNLIETAISDRFFHYQCSPKERTQFTQWQNRRRYNPLDDLVHTIQRIAAGPPPIPDHEKTKACCVSSRLQTKKES